MKAGIYWRPIVHCNAQGDFWKMAVHFQISRGLKSANVLYSFEFLLLSLLSSHISFPYFVPT